MNGAVGYGASLRIDGQPHEHDFFHRRCHCVPVRVSRPSRSLPIRPHVRADNAARRANGFGAQVPDRGIVWPSVSVDHRAVVAKPVEQ